MVSLTGWRQIYDFFRLYWQRMILIALPLAAAVLLPFTGSQKLLIYICIAVAGGAGFLILFNKPMLGIIFIVVGGLAVPIEIGTGSETSINPAILLVGLMTAILVVDVVANKRIYKLKQQKLVLPLLALLLSVTLSFGVGQLHWFPSEGAPLRAELGGVGIFFLSVFAFLVASYFIETTGWLEVLTWTFIILFGYSIIRDTFLTNGTSLSWLRPKAAGGSLMWVWGFSLTFSQLAYNRRLSLKLRAFLAGVLLLAVYTSFFLTRDWLSGWFPALIGLLAIIIIGNWKVGLPFMALGGLFVLLNLPTVSGLVSGGDNTYSLMTRQKAWEILIEIIKVNPILGLGPSNYYWYTALFNILGYYVTFNSHNNYVDIIAQTGFLGKACFQFFFTQIGLTIWKLLPRVPQGFPRAYLLGALGGLVGTLAAGVFGDWIIPFVYNIGFAGFRASVLCWLFLGGVTAIQNGAILNRGELP